MRGLLSAAQSAPRASAGVQAADGGFEIDLGNPEHVKYLRQGGMTVSGAAVNETTAMRVAAVWRGVHILAGTAGNMPIDLMRRVGETARRPAVDHPARRLLTTKPNGWLTPQDFKRMLTAHVVLRGNGYAFKVAGRRGVDALWPIHPDRCRPVLSSGMELLYEYTAPSGAKRGLAPDEVFHVRGLTLDGVTGIGILAFARETIGQAMQAQHAASKLWKQGAMVGGALEHPATLSEEAFGRLKDSIAERNSGADNAGKWLILEEGMKASDLSLSPQDMQFLESRQFTSRELLMFMGVPPFMAGDTEKTTSWGSGIEQQKDGFVAFTAEDYLTAWEQSAGRDLLTEAEAETHYWRFNRNSLIRGDIKTRSESYAKALQWGWMSPDDVRALEDMNPRPDGRGGVFYDPPNTAGGAGDKPEDGNDPPTDPQR